MTVEGNRAHRRVEAVRRFNRFYTKQIGLLRASLLRSGFSLMEARILFELAHRQDATATDLSGDLAVDPGYLSRILRRFQNKGLVEKTHSRDDGRMRLLRLTDAGEEAFATLNSRSRHEVASMLAALSEENQRRLLNAMSTIETVLEASPERPSGYIIRPHQPGDIGWVIHRHGVLYSEEYGWDETFEALVAEILADFAKGYDARRERSWIAEIEGEIVGSVFVVKENEETARLRLLLVEPKARAAGLGTRLVDECIKFARRTGYKKLTLWTNDVLHAARRIYERAGFQLVEEHRHHSFGHDLVGQTWELDLR
jgi:DNA-binding MarR family transcriptional regulator/GNAT superfamily N-acetyltransferase